MGYVYYGCYGCTAVMLSLSTARKMDSVRSSLRRLSPKPEKNIEEQRRRWSLRAVHGRVPRRVMVVESSLFLEAWQS